VAKHSAIAPSRRKKTEDHPQRRRFSRSIPSEKSVNRTPGHVQVEIAHDAFCAEEFGELARLNRKIGHRKQLLLVIRGNELRKLPIKSLAHFVRRKSEVQPFIHEGFETRVQPAKTLRLCINGPPPGNEHAFALLRLQNSIPNKGGIRLASRVRIEDQLLGKRSDTWNLLAWNKVPGRNGTANLIGDLTIDRDRATRRDGDFQRHWLNYPYYLMQYTNVR
jgi:hypothetical protein